MTEHPSKQPDDLITEKRIIALIAAIQFVNVLDFMMVMPLGPDFAKELGIHTSKLGMIGGSYTASATVSGLIGSLFLDRFDRRKALFFAMLGLACGTFAGAFATDLTTLMLARILAGLFGGPATSLSLSIIADVVPPTRRGRAMGTVMGAFSIASIFGVPAGLELARIGGWRLPFIAVGGVALLITFLAIALLPPMKTHLWAPNTSENQPENNKSSALSMLKRPEVALSYLTVAIGMFGGFLMIPNLSAYLQNNLAYPRAHLGFLYFCGGILSLILMRVAGILIDRISAFGVNTAATLILISTLATGYLVNPPLIPIFLIFSGFMVGMSVRNVSVTSISTRVPRFNERARFMSFQSAVQHFSGAVGAFTSTQFLQEGPDGILIGMPRLAMTCIILSACIPLIVRNVEKRVKNRESGNKDTKLHIHMPDRAALQE